MQFRIKILDINITSANGKNGKPYQVAEVSFKNLTSGKVEAKKILSFSNVWKKVSTAETGGEYDVVSEKEGEYWQWTSFETASGETPVAPQSPRTGTTGTANPAPRSNFETPEERAQRQVLIVRQSCLSNAITSLNAGKGVKPDEATALAQHYVDWVFSNEVKEEGEAGLTEMEDDIPY